MGQKGRSVGRSVGSSGRSDGWSVEESGRSVRSNSRSAFVRGGMEEVAEVEVETDVVERKETKKSKERK